MGDLDKLRTRLAEAEATLRAIGSGEVDAVIGTGQAGTEVYTLGTASDAYRTLIESMNEGALILTHEKLILYANGCFAKMVGRPLERVIGASLKDFIKVEDQPPLRELLSLADHRGSKLQMVLQTGDGAPLPVLISIRALAMEGSDIATYGVVITDMTEPRRHEELLRGFSQRLVKVLEEERERVAFELHGQITQQLCAILLQSEILAETFPSHTADSMCEAEKLRKMLGEATNAVERISGHLRPSVLDHLGLSAMLHSAGPEFSARTGVPLELNCGLFTSRLPADAELAFYRILQEALKNVEHHAQAKQATIHLTQHGAFVEMSIQDDGIGFDQDITNGKPRFGLHSMRERATGVGGSVSVKSSPGHGTTIHAQIPFNEKKSSDITPTPS